MLNARILISKETVNDLNKSLHQAYKAGDAKLLRRISALISFSRGEQVSEIAGTLGISASSVYK